MMPCPDSTWVPSLPNALMDTAVVCEHRNFIPSAPSLILIIGDVSTTDHFPSISSFTRIPPILSELGRTQCKHTQPWASLQRGREGHIKPLQLCVPFAYEKTVSNGLFIMHKSLLTCLYCNTLFLSTDNPSTGLHQLARYARFELFNHSSLPLSCI